jgi:DNA-binding NarL/FixJ family response regulator
MEFMSTNLSTLGEERRQLSPQIEAWTAPDGRERRELTPRQRQILVLIAQGRSNKEIAFALGIRERTVKFHVASLFERLGTSSRTECLIVALRLRLVQLDDIE